MGLGPIEVLVLGFPGNQFNGEILPELQRLVESDTIHLIDGLLLRKDADGEVTFSEFGEEDDSDSAAARSPRSWTRSRASSPTRTSTEFAAGLEPDCSAAVLVFEHTWAKPLRDAVVASGGVLAANFRVPGVVVDDLMAALADID